MKNISIRIFILLLLNIQISVAQSGLITGTVTSANDGSVLPGVKVILKSSSSGTYTNGDGYYSITVMDTTGTLVFSSEDMKTMEVSIGTSSVINIAMELQVSVADELVMTALNIPRQKGILGYATQNLDGEGINVVKNDNIITALSGRVAGMQVKNTGNLWGSADIVMRGHSSIYGSNQVLFVVDGMPLQNTSLNSENQIDGRHGYDYGNIISDINPEDVESISVLKGASACALYGSQGANGVIMITTKRGRNELKNGKKMSVNYNSSITIGTIDKSTFPKYQKEYGAGYSSTYYSDSDHPGLEYYLDVDNDGAIDYNVPYSEDASMGEKFDPYLKVFQFDAAEPASDNYLKKTPWVAAENGPETFFQTAVNFTNSVALNGKAGGFDYRLLYTNMNKTGIMPNSSYKRNNLAFNGQYQILDNLKAGARIAYNQSHVKGRNSTGYRDNILSSFRQFYQVNVDTKTLENLYNITQRNVTWNRVSFEDGDPMYWDNPYWVCFQNYETDERENWLGSLRVEYAIIKGLTLKGQYAFNNYNDLQEERKAIGSVSDEFGVSSQYVSSGYSRYIRDIKHSRLDLLLNYTKVFAEKFYLNANLGYDKSDNEYDNDFASTDGGLAVAGLYSLSNSKDGEYLSNVSNSEVKINGYSGFVTLGYDNLLFLDGAYRYEIFPILSGDITQSSFYSVSGSFLFNKFIHSDNINLGKFRLNYAVLGNSYSSDSDDLVPELTKSYETGLDLIFFQNRLGVNVNLYHRSTENQLLEMSLAYGIGYSSKWKNMGKVENNGVELTLNGTPVKMNRFKWDIGINWSTNKNKVINLNNHEDATLDEITIASMQGGISIVAKKGESYQTIIGTDFVYDSITGQKVVDQKYGTYEESTSSENVLGHVTPDYNMGISNTLSYKNFKLSFLIDIQKGGSVFSLDQWYGQSTGLYDNTVGDNDLGNPVRDPIIKNADGTYDDASGGFLNEGSDGEGNDNTVRAPGNYYWGRGYALSPNAQYVYDASYVKLRELTITYNFPESMLSKLHINGLSLSFVGSNLWIIHKNLPYADPEASQGYGNIQGWQSGVMPTTRNFGVDLNVYF